MGMSVKDLAGLFKALNEQLGGLIPDIFSPPAAQSMA